MIELVISGGQTGSDQAGLEAARQFGIKTGGYAPFGWKTLKGPQQKLLQSYGLTEHRGGYADRTWDNVKWADATFRIAYNFQSPGEQCTLRAIQHWQKPYFNVYLTEHVQVGWADAIAFLNQHNVKILNISGNANRKSYPFDIYIYALDWLIELFHRLGYKKPLLVERK